MTKANQKTTQSPDGRRLIRKYPNRRLYDVKESRYIQWSDLFAMINRGEDVLIIEHKGQRDVTLPVLIRALAGSPDVYQVLSVGNVHALIRSLPQ